MSKHLWAKVGFTVLTMFGMGTININSASALTITYNAGLDFSPTENPNGVWTYGNSNSLSNTSAFTSYSLTSTLGNGLVTWDNGGETYISGNPTDQNIITFFQGQVNVVYEPDELYLVPSTSNNQGYAIVRWTSPYSSDYSINALFQTKDQLAFTTPTVDTFVYLNGTQLYGDFLSGVLDSGSFNTNLSLESGDILDFIVGSPNNRNDDTTGLELSITTTLSVPEPSTIIGLGILTTLGLGTGFKRKLNKANK